MNNYSVREVRFRSGERFPVLVDGQGMPLFGPTVYALTIPRAKGRAANTVENILRAIQVFLEFLTREQIDFQARLELGVLLTLREIDLLVRWCRKPLRGSSGRTAEGIAQGKVTALPKAHRTKPKAQAVSQELLGVRLSYIRAYIAWEGRLRVQRPGTSLTFRRQLEKEVDLLSGFIKERMPVGKAVDPVGQVESFGPDVEAKIIRVIKPKSAENPWKSLQVQIRNQLIILWFIGLGLRRGELLAIKVSDINFRNGTVVIHRRPDDPEDYRNRQPQVKTLARKLELNSDLLRLTEEYIREVRATFKAADKHNYLFVSCVSGEPLSLISSSKIFENLREKVDGIPANLSGHKFRHRWNDRFSELMDENKVDPEIEKKIRSFQMGWKENSNTASVYTRRHTRAKAGAVSLQLQNKVIGSSEDSEDE